MPEGLMTYAGEVRDGVVVFDRGAAPPEGTRVSVQPVEAAADPSPPNGDRLPRVAELAVETGIPDLGRNIDHYLYGHPRQGPAGEGGDGT
jgi:hypothetical protein